MAIINRISRLFTADIHAVLDRIEEPDALLRQCIREMEARLADAEHQIRARAREREHIGTRQRHMEKSLADIESQLDVCFEAGKTDLARALIRRRLEHQRSARWLAARRDTMDGELAERQAALDENRARLESMRQQAELFAEEVHPASSANRDGAGACADSRVSDDEVEVAFLAEQQRRATS
jgi:phage shock protein A